MSVQQINLLNPRLLTLRVMFSAKTLAGTLLAVVVLGLVLYGVVESNAGSIRQQLDQAQAKRDQLQAKLDALIQPAEAVQATADKQAMGLALQREQIAHLETLRAALGLAQQKITFSARLRALTQVQVPGVWLTGLEVGEQGFHLQGRALETALIPDYLARLAQQAALKDLPLTGFSIASPNSGENTPVQGVAFAVNPESDVP